MRQNTISIIVADQAWSKVPRLRAISRAAARQTLDYVSRSLPPSPEVRPRRNAGGASKGGVRHGTAVLHPGAPCEASALRACAPQGSGDALDTFGEPHELAIRFAGDAEVANLNQRWRGKNRATNVLSFPTPVQSGQLGDIVLAFGVVAAEAKDQGKSLEAHTAHLVVHGVLHLLGFDHRAEQEAKRMEEAEVAILARIGYENPYILA